MWSELETLVSAHAGTSDNHKRILECLLEVRKPTEEQRRRGSGVGGKEDLTEVDSAWKDLDR